MSTGNPRTFDKSPAELARIAAAARLNRKIAYIAKASEVAGMAASALRQMKESLERRDPEAEDLRRRTAALFVHRLEDIIADPYLAELLATPELPPVSSGVDPTHALDRPHGGTPGAEADPIASAPLGTEITMRGIPYEELVGE